MPYRLKKGVYAVRCRYPQCTFEARMEIDQNLMGMTEWDVEIEAVNMARGMAMIKHDSLLRLRRHMLTRPEIRRVSGYTELVGGGPVSSAQEMPDVVYKDFHKGEIIVKKGEEADSICEIVRGMAYPERNKDHRYSAGDCFGAAALLMHQNRMANIVSGSDRTRVAFYNLTELTKRDPKKAREVYNRILQDTFKVIRELEHTVDRC
jgi:hypothetical protein